MAGVTVENGNVVHYKSAPMFRKFAGGTVAQMLNALRVDTVNLTLTRLGDVE